MRSDYTRPGAEPWWQDFEDLAEALPEQEQCTGSVPSMSPPLERCALVEGHEGDCQ